MSTQYQLNVNQLQSIISRIDDGNQNDNLENEKAICIWDADGDKTFSKADVSAYLETCYPDINNKQKTNLFTKLEESFAKKIKYTNENIKTITLNLNKIIKKITQNDSKMDIQETVNGVINGMKKEEEDTKRILPLAKLLGYNPTLSVKNSQIKNQYYTGGLYDIQFDGLKVTITNQNPIEGHRAKHTIDLYKMLGNMSDIEIVKFLLFIQKQPGEMLEDLAIEMDDLQSTTGHDMHTSSNPNFVAGAYYCPIGDEIVTTPSHLVHELGHAVDYAGEVNMSTTVQNKDFQAIFDKELDAYIKAGNVRFDKDNKDTWLPDGDKYNYCTTNVKEMYAEIYTLVMSGNCRSKTVITKYFPKTMQMAIRLIQETRQQSDLDRRYTPIREIVHNLENFQQASIK